MLISNIYSLKSKNGSEHFQQPIKQISKLVWLPVLVFFGVQFFSIMICHYNSWIHSYNICLFIQCLILNGPIHTQYLQCPQMLHLQNGARLNLEHMHLMHIYWPGTMSHQINNTLPHTCGVSQSCNHDLVYTYCAFLKHSEQTLMMSLKQCRKYRYLEVCIFHWECGSDTRLDVLILNFTEWCLSFIVSYQLKKKKKNFLKNLLNSNEITFGPHSIKSILK